MLAVFRKELNSYFHGIVAYLFGASLLVFIGVSAVLYNVASAVANFELVLGSVSILLVFIIPILTMKTFAEERRQRTDQLLYSLPLTMTQIVLGKFLALLVVYAIPLCVACVYPLIFKRYGSVYLPASYGAIFAFFMLGATLIAICMFISSLTENQGVAAGISVVVCLLTYFSVNLANYVPSKEYASIIVLTVFNALCAFVVRQLVKSNYAGFYFFALVEIFLAAIYKIKKEVYVGLISKLMEQISVFSRFYVFVNGVLDLSAVVYFISVMALFLFLCVQSLEKRRYN